MSRRKRGYALFIVAAPVSALVVYAVTRPFLPHEIVDMNAIPFLTREPTTPELALGSWGFQTVIAAVVAGVALWRTAPGSRMLPYGRFFVYYGWLTSTWASFTLLQNVGAADVAASEERWWVWWALTPLVLPLYVLHGKLEPIAHVDQADLPLPGSSLALRADERVAWTATSSDRRAGIEALAIAVAVVAAAILWYPPALVGLVFSASTVVLRTQRVTVDGQGITVRTMIPLTRLAIPLHQVRSVAARDVPRHAGALHGDADDRIVARSYSGIYAVNRRGAALVVEYGYDQVATISVDNADQGADVVNALLARLRAGATSPVARHDRLHSPPA